MIARLKLELKSQRFFYLVPVIMVWVVTPISVYGNYLACGGDIFSTRLFAIGTVQQFVPLFAVWWPVFVLREYLNAPGNELLYVYRFGWDTLLTRTIALWIWYGLHWTVLCGGMALILPRLEILFALVWAQCLFLMAGVYLIAMITGNTLLPLIVSVLYCLAGVLFRVPVLNIFALETLMVESAELWRAVIMLGLSVLMFAGGYALERRLLKKG